MRIVGAGGTLMLLRGRRARGVPRCPVWICKDARLQQEAAQYRLVFCCEDCANFSPTRDGCSILYPTEPHRRATVEALAEGERLLFCKMFEPA